MSAAAPVRATDRASRLRAELMALRRASRDRMLHPEKIVAWAAAHPRSALHGQFEWDDSRAAREYRLWQARRLIQLTVVASDGAPLLVSLSIDRGEGGGYRDIAEVVKDRRLSEVMLADAIRDLERVEQRYRRVAQLTAMWKEFDAVRRRVAAPKARDLRRAA